MGPAGAVTPLARLALRRGGPVAVFATHGQPCGRSAGPLRPPAVVVGGRPLECACHTCTRPQGHPWEWTQPPAFFQPTPPVCGSPVDPPPSPVLLVAPSVCVPRPPGDSTPVTVTVGTPAASPKSPPSPPSLFVHSPYTSPSPSADLQEFGFPTSPSFMSSNGSFVMTLDRTSLPGSPPHATSDGSPAPPPFAPATEPLGPPTTFDGNDEDAPSEADPEGTPQPSPLCSHPRPWKRLRARRGTTTFACLLCHTRWQVRRRTGAGAVSSGEEDAPLP
eukprot:EG_transcript_13112